jgi:hypothetical protein
MVRMSRRVCSELAPCSSSKVLHNPVSSLMFCLIPVRVLELRRNRQCLEFSFRIASHSSYMTRDQFFEFISLCRSVPCLKKTLLCLYFWQRDKARTHTRTVSPSIMPSLDDLPTELINNVSTSLDCADILAMHYGDRKLSFATTDAFFRSLVHVTVSYSHSGLRRLEALAQ